MNFSGIINAIMPDVQSGSNEPFLIYRDNVGSWHFAHTQNQYGEVFDWVEDIKTQDLFAVELRGKYFSGGSFPYVHDAVLCNRIRAEFYHNRDSGAYSGDSIEAFFEGMGEKEAYALACFFEDNVGAFSQTVTNYLTTIERPYNALAEMCPFNMATEHEGWSYNEDLATDAVNHIEKAVNDRLQTRNGEKTHETPAPQKNAEHNAGMSELKQRLLIYELAKIGYPDAAYIPESDKVMIQPNKEQMVEIIGADGIRYWPEYRDLAMSEINPIVSKVNEIIAAWENSRPAPFDSVSHFNILVEYNNVVLAARDDGEYGRGLHFVTWRYDLERTELYSGQYTDDYANAKEAFALRSGLIKEEKVITREQAADIKAAIDFSMENGQAYAYEARFTKINEKLCDAYPELSHAAEAPERERAKEEKTLTSRKNPTLQEKLDAAKSKAREADAHKDATHGEKPKKRDERE